MAFRRALVFMVGMAWVISARGAEFIIDGKTFRLPDGFEIKKIAGPPLVDRPITADFDELGRLYIADSSGSNDKVEKQLAEKPHRIVRLEDTNSDGVFDKQTVFADNMMFLEGTMWHDGSLYVAAPPSIWKLTDTDNDGAADKREEWFKGKTLTGCANDLHGPYLGPDGWIYWCKGAFAQQTIERPGKKPIVTKASHIYRARPDGTGQEIVMTGGMDNPVDVVFMPGGERIFTTTFLQNPGGGKRDGLIHAVYGGVWGKQHDVIENHPRTGPELMPVLSHLGPAAPCGLVRHESPAWGAGYQDNLFSASFNLHKIFRHVLKRKGASFESTDSEFLVCDHVDFHPTDVIEDADGSLIVIDTGGWYKLCCPTSQLVKADVLGAVYRITKKGTPSGGDPRFLKFDWNNATDAELAAGLGKGSPAFDRRALSRLTKSQDRSDRLAFSLGIAFVHADRGGDPDAAQEALVWAAMQLDTPELRKQLRQSVSSNRTRVAVAAIRSLGLMRDAASTGVLIARLSESDLHIRRAAAEALGRIGGAGVVPALLKALEQPEVPTDRFLEHSYIYALIEIGDAALTAKGLDSNNPTVRRGALIALDQMEGGGLKPVFVAGALEAKDSRLREAAIWIAGRHPEWGGDLAAALGARMMIKQSDQERAELVAQVAKLAKSPGIADMLADRVADGLAWHKALEAMGQSGLKDVPEKWITALAELASGDDLERAAAAANAARRLAIKKDPTGKLAPALAKLAGRENTPAAVRLDALAAMPGGPGALDDRVLAFLLTQLAADVPAGQRAAGVDVITKAKWTKAQLMSLADAIRSAGALEIDRLLAVFDGGSDEEVGMRLIESLAGARSVNSVRPDMLKVRLKKYPQSVQDKAEPLYVRLNPDAAAQKAKLDKMLANLPKGDIRRGQLIFNSTKAACVTCHAIGYVGGQIGPDLTKIGAIRQERDLLESIVFPSASFVQSYESTIVETTDGDVQSGVMKKNDAQEVVLVIGPQQEVRIARGEVKAMRPGQLSIMPAGLEQQISEQELADLVAFLRACK